MSLTQPRPGRCPCAPGGRRDPPPRGEHAAGLRDSDRPGFSPGFGTKRNLRGGPGSYGCSRRVTFHGRFGQRSLARPLPRQGTVNGGATGNAAGPPGSAFSSPNGTKESTAAAQPGTDNTPPHTPTPSPGLPVLPLRTNLLLGRRPRTPPPGRSPVGPLGALPPLSGHPVGRGPAPLPPAQGRGRG